MPIPKRIWQFLMENNAEYEHRIHPPAFSARSLAAADHVPLSKIAKTVVFLGDETFAMAVLPGDEKIDVEALRKALGLERLRLATEEELSHLFPECEIGAMPPFGSLFGLAVYVDKRLAEQEEIEFNGGTHQNELRMTYAEYARLAQPKVVDFGRPAFALASGA